MKKTYGIVEAANCMDCNYIAQRWGK